MTADLTAGFKLTHYAMYLVTSPVPDTNLSFVTKEAMFPTVSPVPWVPVETDSA